METRHSIEPDTTPATTRSTKPHSYPTLQFIDRARGELQPAFAGDPHADMLEGLARQLTADYWSEFALLTGEIPAAAFHHVCNELERQRLAAATLTSTSSAA
jgi:hypothetical protein